MIYSVVIFRYIFRFGFFFFVIFICILFSKFLLGLLGWDLLDLVEFLFFKGIKMIFLDILKKM